MKSGSFHRSILLVLCAIPVWLSAALAGNPDSLLQAVKPDSLAREGALKVYLEGFSDSYFKESVTFVNYVRDPDAADVYAALGAISVGGGAGSYSIELKGMGRFAGMNDTLQYFSGPTNNYDDDREGILRLLKMGLMRYVARTPLAADIDIACRRSMPPRAVEDPWDAWVFRTSASGGLSGNQREGDYRIGGSVSASRITEELKIDLGGSFSYRDDETALTTRTLHNIYRTNGFDALVVKSVTDHWSAGGFASGNYSTTGNIKTIYAAAPAVEFSLFPYAQASTRAITALYRIEYSYATYHDVTIYDKTEEGLWRQALGIYMNMTRPWGSAYSSIGFSQYLHDTSINSLTGSVSFSYRLFRGLSVDIGGSYTRNHDLIDQPRRSLTDDEILLRLRSLFETYSYSTSIGFSYTFGSIYSNVVNPRF